MAPSSLQLRDGTQGARDGVATGAKIGQARGREGGGGSKRKVDASR